MDLYLKNYLELNHKMLEGGGSVGKKITFVTGNMKKLEELKAILGNGFPFELDNAKIDLPELQGEPEEVAIEKAKLAAKEINGPILIEDTSLCFNALGGLPGVYIKWFFEKVGNEGLYKMLEGFEDKSGYAQCIFTFCAGPGSVPITFVGRTPGKIVKPRGPEGFGWDPVFEPDEHDKTFAELDKEVKNKISHRFNSLMKVKNYFEEHHDEVEKEINKTGINTSRINTRRSSLMRVRRRKNSKKRN
jgi:inosine triphosphate pyrophosphatase